MVGNLTDEFGMSDSSTVDAHFVGTCIEQAIYILQLVDTTAHRKWDIDFGSHTSYHVGKGLALLKASRDVEKDKFVGSCIAIGFTQFHRVACATEVDEVGAFHRLAILHVETRNDSLCQAFASI